MEAFVAVILGLSGFLLLMHDMFNTKDKQDE